jgi:2-phospho-L-lactate guanylyltransferase
VRSLRHLDEEPLRGEEDSEGDAQSLNRTAVLIPFKAGRSKSRLSKVLDADQRRRLAELMLAEVLGVFRRLGLLPRCYVISSDLEVLALARGLGARVIAEPRDEGVNAAVEIGVRALGRDRDFIIAPSDLPLLAPDEVKTALTLKRVFDCVISPSRSFDGTNLLAFSGRAAPALSYDSDSFWNHVRGAARTGLSLAVCCSEGVMFDVDTPEDLRALARTRRKIPSAEFAKEALRE